MVVIQVKKYKVESSNSLHLKSRHFHDDAACKSKWGSKKLKFKKLSEPIQLCVTTSINNYASFK